MRRVHTALAALAALGLLALPAGAVVLKDADLDLAFIRPREATKVDFVELKTRDLGLQALDEVFVVGRLGRAANRAIALTTGSVKSVVKGPRTFYVCDDEVSQAGCV